MLILAPDDTIRSCDHVMMTSRTNSEEGSFMRKMTYEQLKNRAPSPLMVAERFHRQATVRRKPRSPEETRLLAEMVATKVLRAKESGELERHGQKFRIRIK